MKKVEETGGVSPREGDFWKASWLTRPDQKICVETLLGSTFSVLSPEPSVEVERLKKWRREVRSYHSIAQSWITFLGKSHKVAINVRPVLRVTTPGSALSHFSGYQSG